MTHNPMAQRAGIFPDSGWSFARSEARIIDHVAIEQLPDNWDIIILRRHEPMTMDTTSAWPETLAKLARFPGIKLQIVVVRYYQSCANIQFKEDETVRYAKHFFLLISTVTCSVAELISVVFPPVTVSVLILMSWLIITANLRCELHLVLFFLGDMCSNLSTTVNWDASCWYWEVSKKQITQFESPYKKIESW